MGGCVGSGWVGQLQPTEASNDPANTKDPNAPPQIFQKSMERVAPPTYPPLTHSSPWGKISATQQKPGPCPEQAKWDHAGYTSGGMNCGS